MAREMGGVGGLSVYITQNSGRSACLPMATVTFWCSGMSSNDVTTRLAAAIARSLPVRFRKVYQKHHLPLPVLKL